MFVEQLLEHEAKVCLSVCPLYSGVVVSVCVHCVGLLVL